MSAFETAHGPTKKLLIGGDGTPLDAFLLDHGSRSPKLG
jgi:hypothetical protein